MEIETTLAELPKHLEKIRYPPESKVHLIVEEVVSKEDTVLQLGTSPVVCNTSDASTHHDRYLTTPSE